MATPLNDTPGIILLGLGPGDPALLTHQAWELLDSIDEIYLRTRQHPVVAGFPSNLKAHSFDDLFRRFALATELHAYVSPNHHLPRAGRYDGAGGFL